MGSKTRTANQVKVLKGKGKELIGSTTGSEELTAQGKNDQATADLAQAGESVRDAAVHVKDALTGR
jgi:uncharacterized protein YjbJ (UPF0337 family)